LQNSLKKENYITQTMLGRQNDGRKRIDAKSLNIKQFFITL